MFDLFAVNFLKVVETCFSVFRPTETRYWFVSISIYENCSLYLALFHLFSETNGENVIVMVIMTMKY